MKALPLALLKGLMSLDQQRKKIHDLANSMSIVEATVSRALSTLSKNHPELADEIARLKKADEYTKKSIADLTELRDLVHAQIKKGEV